MRACTPTKLRNDVISYMCTVLRVLIADYHGQKFGVQTASISISEPASIPFLQLNSNKTIPIQFRHKIPTTEKMASLLYVGAFHVLKVEFAQYNKKIDTLDRVFLFESTRTHYVVNQI